METQRFDEWARSLADFQSSRRSVLRRVGGGGLAAALAALGLGGLDVEEADAKKSCKKRCKKRKTAAKRRRCRRRCKKLGPRPECTGSGECPGTQICVENSCIDRPVVPIACSDTDPCDGGLICVGNICVLECEDDDECDGGLLCLGGICVLDTECDEDDDCDDPLLEICLLGLCVDDIL